jgi:hypothetical protein
MANRRRRIKQTQSLEKRLAAEAARLRMEAEAAPPGVERELLLKRARQCDTGSDISDCLSSPRLQTPK